jgi:ribosomal protein S18 acetylase RimI-like enzyme
MVLRPAREGDVEAMIDLARRSWPSAFTDAPEVFIRHWLAREFERVWYPKHWSEMTVAEEGGEILGLVQPTADEINGLWVDPGFHGRGVGSALLAEGERQIAAAGYRRAWLSCSAFNPKGVRFYLTRGYRQFRSETKDRAGGVVETMLYFERALSPILETARPAQN